MSRGDIVPDVMTTLLKRSKTGLMASEGSRQVKWNMGFGTVVFSPSNGSRMRRNPSSDGFSVVQESINVNAVTFLVC
jgi:hypothetical protein